MTGIERVRFVMPMRRGSTQRAHRGSPGRPAAIPEIIPTKIPKADAIKMGILVKAKLL
jgi:hypothetical protein